MRDAACKPSSVGAWYGALGNLEEGAVRKRRREQHIDVNAKTLHPRKSNQPRGRSERRYCPSLARSVLRADREGCIAVEIKIEIRVIAEPAELIHVGAGVVGARQVAGHSVVF